MAIQLRGDKAQSRILPDLSAAAELVGKTVGGQFRIREPLAWGGESIAYIAEQVTAGGRTAAVKIVHQALLRLVMAESRSPDDIPYNREVRLMNLVRHPALPHLYATGRHTDGRPFLAMEYVDGPTLADRLRDEGPLFLDEAVPLVREVFAALRTLHLQRVVHRDLKPEHVILQPGPQRTVRPRLLDLGHALALDDPREKSDGKAPEPIGTPGYMAPELARGERGGERSDIFELGLLLYEAFAGVPAIHLESPSPDRLIAYVLSDAALPTHRLSAVRPNLPRALDGLFARALHRTPRRRFATVEAFERAFLETLAQDGRRQRWYRWGNLVRRFRSGE